MISASGRSVAVKNGFSLSPCTGREGSHRPSWGLPVDVGGGMG